MDDNRKRTKKEIIIDGSSVDVFNEFKKAAIKTQAGSNEGINGCTQPIKKAKGPWHKEIIKPASLHL